jgi:nucleoside-diphosphate-sugar epimerase
MKIFVTGANGYIGGSVAAVLAARGHAVRGLVRDRARVEQVRTFGIEPVVGTLDDTGLLIAEAKAADAVINAADSDHLGAVQALLKGLGGTGKRFIHTSGTSLVGDEALGAFSDAIFDEQTPFVPAPDKAPRIAINRLIQDAAPGVHSVILCNSLIYGNALGPAAQSVQLPALVSLARKTGTARHVGSGLNRWSNVHVADLVDLYLLALEKAPAGSFYFVENGESSFRDITDAIGKALGLGPAQEWEPDEAIAHWGRRMAVFSLGSNSRVCADKARSELGWTPAHSSVLRYILEELPT